MAFEYLVVAHNATGSLVLFYTASTLRDGVNNQLKLKTHLLTCKPRFIQSLFVSRLRIPLSLSGSS